MRLCDQRISLNSRRHEESLEYHTVWRYYSNLFVPREGKKKSADMTQYKSQLTMWQSSMGFMEIAEWRPVMFRSEVWLICAWWKR